MKKILIISLFIFIIIGNFFNLCHATEANVIVDNTSNVFYTNELKADSSTDSSKEVSDSVSEPTFNAFQQDNVSKLTNSINKLPQTGDFFNTTDGLYLIIALAVISLAAIIFKTVEYKK